MTWNIRLETSDGQVKEFKALSCYEITEEQKARWVKTDGDEMKVTATRIKIVSEIREGHYLNRR
jgi:hypothetical protein